jgi:hypothetical protein
MPEMQTAGHSAFGRQSHGEDLNVGQARRLSVSILAAARDPESRARSRIRNDPGFFLAE